MLTARERPRAEVLLDPFDAVVQIGARDHDVVKFAAAHAAF